jgi:hypothetical protein
MKIINKVFQAKIKEIIFQLIYKEKIINLFVKVKILRKNTMNLYIKEEKHIYMKMIQNNIKELESIFNNNLGKFKIDSVPEEYVDEKKLHLIAYNIKFNI